MMIVGNVMKRWTKKSHFGQNFIQNLFFFQLYFWTTCSSSLCQYDSLELHILLVNTICDRAVHLQVNTG